jgi:hypothetical protein
LEEVFKAILEINFCQQPNSIFRVVPGAHSPPPIAEVKYGGATPLLPTYTSIAFSLHLVSLSVNAVTTAANAEDHIMTPAELRR